MSSQVVWLAVFVVASLAALWWAARELAGQKVLTHKGIQYPHHLEFNSSLAILTSIMVTIATSVVVGFLVARFVAPGDAPTPNLFTTVVVVVIWAVALVVDISLFMRAKILHLTWPDNPTGEGVYPTTIALQIALSTLLTLALATISATVVAVLITQVIKAF